MTCDEARERIEEAQLGLLETVENAAFAQHLARCPGCRAEAAEAARFLDVLQAARDPDADARLMSQLDRAANRAAGRRGVVWKTVGIAALALIALTLWWSGGPTTLTSGVEHTLASGREIALERARATSIDGARVTQLSPRDVRLHTGSMRFRVEPSSGPFTVRTPRGQVHVTGTEFEVQIMSSGTSLKAVTGVAVLVATGAVIYALDGRDAEVSAGELLVDVGEGEPRTFRATDIRDLVVDHRTQSKELERLQLRIDRLQKDLAARRVEHGTDGPDPGEVDERTANGTDEGDAADDPNKSAIEATDWSRITAAIAARYAKSDKRPTRAERMQMMSEFTYMEARLQAIAEEKGLGTVGDAALHPEVMRRLLDAALPGLLPDTDAAVRERIRERLLASTATALQGLERPYLAIEQQWVRVRSAVQVGDALQAQVPAKDLHRVLRAWVDATFINSTSVSMSSGTAAQLEEQVVRSWKRRLEIDAELASGARDIARKFVEGIDGVLAEASATHSQDVVNTALNAISAQGAEDFPTYLTQLRVCDGLLDVHRKTERELLAVLSADDSVALVESGLSLMSLKIKD